MFKNYIFYKINTHQLSIQKFVNLKQPMGQMTFVYTGYESLYDYVRHTNRLVTCKNNILQVSTDPIVHHDIHHSFNQLRGDTSLCRALKNNDSKTIVVSYRISCFLINNVTSR